MSIKLVAIGEDKSSRLLHYGVKGQKKGVRRWQYKDGSLTPEGRIHYGIGDGRGTSSNIDKVSSRGQLTNKEAEQCISLASKMHEDASRLSGSLTPDIRRALTSSGGLSYGLNHRLKTVESLAAKIGSDAKKDGVSFEDAAKSITDSVRYTGVFNTDDYVNGYNKTKTYLEEHGYTEIACKNYWTKYRDGDAKHKQITSVYADKDGNKFEIQFQTPESQKAKDLKTPLYEESRKVTTSEDKRSELNARMEQLAEKVPNPESVYDIPSHSGLSFLTNALSKVRYKEFDKLMSAEEVKRTKTGSCHDQVMYEVSELRKAGVEPKVRFLIESDDDNHGGATHSFVWFNKDGKVFWLENAWGGQEGLRSYSSESQMMKDVWSHWEKNDKYPYLYDGNIDPNKMKPGMDLGDLLDIVEFNDD